MQNVKLSKNIKCSYQSHIFSLSCGILFFLKKNFINLFLERGEGKEKEREKHQCPRNTSIGCLSHGPNWGPGPQLRHVPSLGIKLAPFLFTGWYLVHGATPARAYFQFGYFCQCLEKHLLCNMLCSFS